MAVVHGALVVLLGPPGAGKSTVAHELCRIMPCDVVSTGALLRQEIATDSPLGQHIKSMIDNGNLVSDEVMHQVLGAFLASRDPQLNLVLDGYPRTLSQAEYLPTFLAQYQRSLTGVVLLDIADEVVVKRLSGRRMCKTASETFPVHVDDAAALAECAARGGTLEMRPDDAPDIVLHRVAVYHQTTAPLIAFFAQQRMLHNVDANGNAASIAQALLTLIERIQ
jgi:adenylate kinase